MNQDQKTLMFKIAQELTQDQIDCVAYVLKGEEITDNEDYRWRKGDIVRWHKENLQS